MRWSHFLFYDKAYDATCKKMHNIFSRRGQKRQLIRLKINRDVGVFFAQNLIDNKILKQITILSKIQTALTLKNVEN